MQTLPRELLRILLDAISCKDMCNLSLVSKEIRAQMCVVLSKKQYWLNRASMYNVGTSVFMDECITKHWRMVDHFPKEQQGLFSCVVTDNLADVKLFTRWVTCADSAYVQLLGRGVALASRTKSKTSLRYLASRCSDNVFIYMSILLWAVKGRDRLAVRELLAACDIKLCKPEYGKDSPLYWCDIWHELDETRLDLIEEFLGAFRSHGLPYLNIAIEALEIGTEYYMDSFPELVSRLGLTKEELHRAVLDMRSEKKDRVAPALMSRLISLQ